MTLRRPASDIAAPRAGQGGGIVRPPAPRTASRTAPVLPRRAAITAAGLAAVGTIPRHAGAQPAAPYPSRQIRILVPFTPGGSPDVLARLVAEEATRRWPAHGAVAENRPGAAGNIAAEATARAAPDGHTILLMSNNIVAVNPHVARMSFDPLSDLVPVALLARSPLVIAVNPDLPIRDLAALVALARTRPREVTYASAGIGSPHHLAMALLCHLTGTEMTHVPYRGTSPALLDVAQGRVMATATPYGTALPLIREGRIRPLAAAGAKPLSALPDIPLASATVPGYECDTWLGLAAPRATPAPILADLEAVSLALMASPRIREALDRAGIEPDPLPARDLAALWRTDNARWGTVIRAAGIREE